MKLLTFLDLFTPHHSSSQAYFYELPLFVVSFSGFRTTQKLSQTLLFYSVQNL